MNDMFEKKHSYTFKSLDFDKVIKLTRDFVKNELSKLEINDDVIIKEADVKTNASLEDAQSIFTSGKFDYIHFSISQRWGNGNAINIFINQKPNRFVIFLNHINPVVGKKIIVDFVKELKLIDIYDSRLLKIKDKAERSYMQEALICRNSNALRAAVIMGWTCVMNKIYSIIENKFKIQFITNIKQKNITNKKFKLKPINKLEDYQQFKDIEILQQAENLFLNKGVTTLLKQFLQLRNDCSHVRVWQPTKSTVDAFFEEIFALSF